MASGFRVPFRKAGQALWETERFEASEPMCCGPSNSEKFPIRRETSTDNGDAKLHHRPNHNLPNVHCYSLALQETAGYSHTHSLDQRSVVPICNAT